MVTHEPQQARDSQPAIHSAPGHVFVALGSNLGDREAHIYYALAELDRTPGVRVLRCSALHETEPVGGPPGQERYLNAVAELDTQAPPRELLALLLEIERRHGRTRGEPDAPRTLDLDLLLYREEAIARPELTIPHPRMWQRDFVLRPLAELCGEAGLRALRERWAGERGPACTST